MKLYLSSYRVPTPEDLFGLLDKPAIECRAAIIPNAKDYKLPEERAASLDDLIVYISGWGIICDVIDLREYDDDAASLEQTLSGYDLVWAAGGNTFILREEMRRSGFEAAIQPILEGGVTYVGESAGAIVAGASLEGSEVADDIELVDEVIHEGLGFVDRIVVPHADSPDFVEYVNTMKKRFKDNSQVLFINDDQAFVVHGDDQKLVTAV